jgi:hypothetical protein
MLTLRKIVCPADFSNPAHGAVRARARQAALTEAEKAAKAGAETDRLTKEVKDRKKEEGDRRREEPK